MRRFRFGAAIVCAACASWAASVPAADVKILGGADITFSNGLQVSGDATVAVDAAGALDQIGSDRGSLLYRGAAAWSILSPGTFGQPLLSGGSGADPTYGVLGVSGGGTNCSAASGTCLDNIAGFASTGLVDRTGAGAYTFKTAPSGAIVGDSDGQTFTNKTIDCAHNTCTVRLGSDVTGNLPAAKIPIGGPSGQVLQTDGAGNGTYVSRRLILSGNSGFGISPASNPDFTAGCNGGMWSCWQPAPATGALKNLYIVAASAPGSSSKTYVITIVDENGNPTAVTCTITDPAISCSDTSHSASITAGHKFGLLLTGTSSAMTSVGFSIELTTP